MQETNEMRDRLTGEFAENYMEKLFYFCLKKTGNNNEAEDLTQDIALQIITALNKGTIPTSFSAWVWQIARNRYSVWAKEKHDRNELRRKAADIATRHYLFCREQIYKEIPDFLKEDVFQIDHACANIFAMRGAVLEEAIKQGYLSFDKDNDKQMLGAYLVI